MKKYVTSESVTEGHPDKLCDLISDAILDAHLEQDKNARVACEVCATTGLVMVMGEISSTATVNTADIARQVVLDVGYDRAKKGFDGHSCAVLTSVHAQSPDIAQGVNRAQDGGQGCARTGAGDQGMMFGYACDETPEMMPMPIALAHRLTKKLSEVRKDKTLKWLRPDGKAQVTVCYEDGAPLYVKALVLSCQHDESIEHDELEREIMDKVVRAVIPAALLNEKTKYYINPTGRFVLGGPASDTGLTGRKIIVDTYGGVAPHGGGAFSGKDPTKVDRSAAYAARHAALNVVKAGLAKKCLVSLAYAIGVAEPVGVDVDSFGTGAVPDEDIERAICSVFDFTPDGIIERFGLRRPIYKQTAAYGHFGRRELELPWEKADKTREILAAIK